MLFVTGLALILVFPGFTHRSAHSFTAKMGWSLLYGLLILIVMPILSILLMVTIVGLPLGLIMLLAYFSLLYIAKVIAGLSIGSALIGRKEKGAGSQILSLFLGLLILELVALIPIVGGLLGFVMLVVGLGAIYFWFMNRHKVNS
jgi:hypothetical protein